MTAQFWNKKKILITGGTSGLGRAIALQLVGVGAEVAVIARREPVPGLPHVHFIQGDISQKHQIHRLYAEAITRLGRVDVLFNNASTLGPTPLKPLLDTECEDLAQVLETNLLGPFRLTKLATAGMLLDGFGIVVNISSDASVSAYPTWGAYGTSKAALDHMTRIFQAELTDEPVHFLALDPGDMDTPMHRAAIPGADRSQLHPPEDSARLILAQIAREEFHPIRRSLR